MEQTEQSPFGPGVTEKQLIEAIDRSGYPLQLAVVDLLSQGPNPNERFHIQQEWSYRDETSNAIRNLDLRADLQLYEDDPQPQVGPVLTLLIECKQSELPYVFFKSRSIHWALNYPEVVGLMSDYLTISSDYLTEYMSGTYHAHVLEALSLNEERFVQAVNWCHTLSKCARKGSKLELSGSEAYNGIVLPLTKALQHLIALEKTDSTGHYAEARLTIPLAVLDAPMVQVDLVDGRPQVNPIQWTRVVRSEYMLEGQVESDRERMWALDVVSWDYLPKYLEEHLLPFSRNYAARVLRHQEELATGLAFYTGMGLRSSEFEQGLCPFNDEHQRRLDLMRETRTPE